MAKRKPTIPLEVPFPRMVDDLRPAESTLEPNSKPAAEVKPMDATTAKALIASDKKRRADAFTRGVNDLAAELRCALTAVVTIEGTAIRSSVLVTAQD